MLIEEMTFNGKQPVVAPAPRISELEMSRLSRFRTNPNQAVASVKTMGTKATAVTGSNLHGAVCTHALDLANESWYLNPIFGKTSHFQHWKVVI